MAAQYAPLIGLWRDASITIEKALGAEHPDTAKSLNILAILLGAQGDYARKDDGGGSSPYGYEPRQSRRAASGAGRLCRGADAFRAGVGDQRNAGGGASQYG